MTPVRLVVAGSPVPYRERQRAFQKDSTGRPITYSYKQRSTRDQQTVLRLAASNAMASRLPFAEPVVLDVIFYMPIPSGMRKADRRLAEEECLPHGKRPDRTQLIKTVEDALNGVVWTDDSLVVGGEAVKLYSPKPRTEIDVRPWSGPALGASSMAFRRDRH